MWFQSQAKTVEPIALPSADTLTVNDIFERYLADCENPNSERGKRVSVESIRAHLRVLRARFGHMTVREFTEGTAGSPVTSRAKIRALCEEWRAEKYAPNTMRTRLNKMRTAFRFAVDHEIIKRADEPVIPLPPAGPSRERYVEEDHELPALLVALDDTDTPEHIRLLTQIMVLTGQRGKTVRSLTWDLVDFEKRVLWFRETQTGVMRSKKRRGNKPMNDELLAIMQRAYRNRNEECPFVIEWQGKPCKSNGRAMRSLFKRAKLEKLVPHDLRRSSATYVYNASEGDLGAAAKQISDSKETTGAVYIVENPNVHLPEMNKVSEVLAKARKAR